MCESDVGHSPTNRPTPPFAGREGPSVAQTVSRLCWWGTNFHNLSTKNSSTKILPSSGTILYTWCPNPHLDFIQEDALFSPPPLDRSLETT